MTLGVEIQEENVLNESSSEICEKEVTAVDECTVKEVDDKGKNKEVVIADESLTEKEVIAEDECKVDDTGNNQEEIITDEATIKENDTTVQEGESSETNDVDVQEEIIEDKLEAKVKESLTVASSSALIREETVDTDAHLSDQILEVETQEEIVADAEETHAVKVEVEEKIAITEVESNTDEVLSAVIDLPVQPQETLNKASDETPDSSSSLAEFQAFSMIDKTPVTFLMQSEMLEKLMIRSESRILITNFEIVPSSTAMNESSDSAVFSGSDIEEKKTASPETEDIYTEFADQQRKISFAQIHNEQEKPTPIKALPRNIPVEAMSANLYLAGSNIKFDLDEKLKICGTPVSPSANVIWKRVAMA